MRTVVHISDIHFGSVDYAIIEPLVQTINEMAPDVVAVSGDLTQRARSREFIEAREFLDRLPKPQIVVPGNHDVPLYNVVDRFSRPLSRFCKFITADLEPFHSDGEIAIAGLNTARSLTIKGGRINHLQISSIRTKFHGLPDSAVKFIVTHHPFDLPIGNVEHNIVGRGKLAMKTFAEARADVFLAGHMHSTHTGHTSVRYKTPDHSALVVQAGTATSNRHRGEMNSFNQIVVDGGCLTITRLVWNPELLHFAPTAGERYCRHGARWLLASGPAA